MTKYQVNNLFPANSLLAFQDFYRKKWVAAFNRKKF